jgi:ATP-dependent Lon protease
MPDDPILNSTQQTADIFKETHRLEEILHSSTVPEELKERTRGMLDRLSRMAKYGFYSQEFEQVSRYIDWITNLPWNKRAEDVLDLKFAKEVLDKHHYGLQFIKDRILEYIAVMKLKRQQLKDKSDEEFSRDLMRAPILFFVGLVGTGKTTISYSIAEAMGRPFVRIPFGGMGDALTLRGQSRVRPDAEVGWVIKAMRQAKVRNPVVLLDEIDRVSEHARADIMGVLVEMLDPGQNYAYTDHFVDYPFDLSQCLFIATANNTAKIATAVLDRLEVIQMPSYTDDEKYHIAKEYVLPRMLKDSGLLVDNLHIQEEVWPRIIRPLGFDSGIRTLERTVNGVCRKVARQIVEEGIQSVNLTVDNIKAYLPTW